MMLSSLLQVTLVMSWATYVVCEHSPGTVIFNAHVSGPDHIPNGDQVYFDVVTVNEGNGYDPSEGTFTVPVSGLYSFHTLLTAQNVGDWIFVHIKSQKQIIATMTGFDKESKTSLAISCVAEMEKGERVWVSTWELTPHPTLIDGQPRKKLGIFSGFKLATAQ